LTQQPRIAFDYKPASASSRRSAHAKWFISGLLLPLIGGAVAYVLANRESPVLAPPPLPPDALGLDLSSLPIEQLSPISQPLGQTIEFVVRRNDTLDRIFRQLKLNLTDLASIRSSSSIACDLATRSDSYTMKVRCSR
jgi:hypothetical protein